MTENQTPTNENVNKFINGVNDYIKVCHKKKVKNVGQQPYSIVGNKKKGKDVGQQQYQSAVRDLSAVRVQDSNPSNVRILNASDVDPNPSNLRILNVCGLDSNPQDVCSWAQRPSCSRKLQIHKGYTVIKHTVLIPCKPRKLPASIRVHFSTPTTTTTTTTTSTPAVPVTRSIHH